MVAFYPDKLAVVEGASSLTYGELDRASNRIARTLQTFHGQRDEPIAILMEPGCALLATTLAVAKAGKCHFGLPMETPIDRLKFILEDMGCALLIADQHNREMAQTLDGNGLTALFVEDILASGDDAPISAEVGPDSLLHVTYTSGSTGQPKGVVRTHRDFLHDVRTRIQTLQLCAQDRIAGFSYGNYNPATISMLTGATYYELHLRRNGSASVVQSLADHEITVLNCKVTTFRQVVRSADGVQTFPSLRIVRWPASRPQRATSLQRGHPSRKVVCSATNMAPPKPISPPLFISTSQQQPRWKTSLPAIQMKASRFCCWVKTARLCQRAKRGKSRCEAPSCHGDTGTGPR
ncbi:MAG: AMP-binding protein [Caldilineaceae bacterium]|nr:AMP-binding protein [Caldilineaceae bacterium]